MNDHQRQREYYAQTAGSYDNERSHEDREHDTVVDYLSAAIVHRGYTSVLDVGAGTGRSLERLTHLKGVTAKGVEPVQELREAGYAKGIAADVLLDGDALNLAFADDAFDVVCAFGVLHHIKDHRRAVSEMCRVARRAVFISDANNYGQGAIGKRLVKHLARAIGAWSALDFVLTRGKGYHFSEGDGVFYSYSLFDDLPAIRAAFPSVRFLTTQPSGYNLLWSAPSVACLAESLA